MKISAHLEFDTFAEAEKVFRHLGMLDGHKVESLGKQMGEQLKQAHDSARMATSMPNGAAASASEEPRVETAPEITLDDMKSVLRAYIGKAGGRTAGTAREILLHHGIAGGKITDAKPEQFAVLKRAFETAGPEMPLGDVLKGEPQPVYPTHAEAAAAGTRANY